MSQDDVQLVSRGFRMIVESIDQGDPPSGIRALFDQGVYSSSCVLTPSQEAGGSERYVGVNEHLEWLRLWTEDFQAWKFWPEKIIEAGDNRVVAIVRQSGQGKGSGAPVELEFGIVFTVREAQVVDVRHYIDPADALQSAGLRE